MSAVPSCTSGSSLVEPLFSGEIQGVCVGPSCDGGSSPPNPPHGILYSLLFDQATIENMGEVCPSGGNLTSASFSGTVSLAP
jgi:hypothetical protein